MLELPLPLPVLLLRLLLVVLDCNCFFLFFGPSGRQLSATARQATMRATQSKRATKAAKVGKQTLEHDYGKTHARCPMTIQHY